MGSERADQIWSGLADLGCGYQVTSWFQPVAELNVFYAEVAGQDDGRSLGATVGAVFNLSKNVRLDVGVSEIIRGRNTDDGRINLANLSLTL
jgi:hypothetical protein